MYVSDFILLKKIKTFLKPLDCDHREFSLRKVLFIAFVEVFSVSGSIIDFMIKRTGCLLSVQVPLLLSESGELSLQVVLRVFFMSLFIFISIYLLAMKNKCIDFFKYICIYFIKFPLFF